MLKSPTTITLKLNLEEEAERKFYEALQKRDRLLFSSQTKYIMYCVLTISGDMHFSVPGISTPALETELEKKKNREILKGIIKETLEEYDRERELY